MSKKYKNKSMEVGAQHIIHQHLKCGWGIGETKHLDWELEVAMVHPERHLGDVLLLYQYLMVAPAEI
jgi:hypothetical protein